MAQTGFRSARVPNSLANAMSARNTGFQAVKCHSLEGCGTKQILSADAETDSLSAASSLLRRRPMIQAFELRPFVHRQRPGQLRLLQVAPPRLPGIIALHVRIPGARIARTVYFTGGTRPDCQFVSQRFNTHGNHRGTTQTFDERFGRVSANAAQYRGHGWGRPCYQVR
jgi:hypothetical protein